MSSSFSLFFFFFKQKTAYEIRISDWSSDVCSSDLPGLRGVRHQLGEVELHVDAGFGRTEPFAVDVGQHRQVQLVAAPGVAEFVGRDQHRRQGRTRLGLKSEERRVGDTWGGTWRCRGSTVSKKNKKKDYDKKD